MMPGRERQQEMPRTMGTGWAPRGKGTQQLVHASNGREELEELGEITPENEQSGGSSPSVELSPYLIRIRGHNPGRTRGQREKETSLRRGRGPLADLHIGIQGAQNGGRARAEWTLGRLQAICCLT